MFLKIKRQTHRRGIFNLRNQEERGTFPNRISVCIVAFVG